MKLLLLGHKGRIGRRYLASLKYLQTSDPSLELLTYDVTDSAQAFEKYHPWQDWQFDKCVIATPTETHFETAVQLIEMKKEFLCEKPVSKSMTDARALQNLADKAGVKGYVVNNWEHAISHARMKAGIESLETKSIIYNYFNHGGDLMVWDCCQLIYIASKNNGGIVIKNDSPIFDVTINHVFKVTLQDIEHSYLQMLSSFLNPSEHFRSKLWTLEQGADMTDSVHKYVANEVNEYVIG